MQFSPTLPAKNTLEVMLKMKILSNRNVIAEQLENAKQCYCKATLLQSNNITSNANANANAKHC